MHKFIFYAHTHTQEASERLKEMGVSSNLVHVEPKDLTPFYLEGDEGWITLKFAFDSGTCVVCGCVERVCRVCVGV
jgi:hypothetical protein